MPIRKIRIQGGYFSRRLSISMIFSKRNHSLSFLNLRRNDFFVALLRTALLLWKLLKKYFQDSLKNKNEQKDRTENR
jgi:hypothetical protein